MSVVDYEVGRQPGPPTRPRVPVDPVTLRVLGGAFHAIAREMAGVLFRMSYSSIIRESEDLGAGLFDPQGRELCESDSTPMHIGSLPWYIRGFLPRLEGEIGEGDVIVHNHPYLGASHTPDIAVAVPMILDGELLGFAAVTAHVLDVGGSFPGINADAFDVYAESKLYNGLRWYEGGRLNRELDRMIFDNVRTETMNRGDMNAMLAACQLGRDRFLALCRRYGVEVVMSAAYEWMDYSERMLRAQIAALPDGEYRAPTAWLDDDARNRGRRLRVETAVIVEGDDITIDLTGSEAEVPTGYNVPFEGSLLVGAYYAVRTLLLDEATFPEHVPQNDGVFRPVKVVAEKGSIFNPRFPRACFSRFCQVQRVVDNTILALSDVLPEQVTAGNSAGIHFCSYSGFVPQTGEYWLYLEVNEGSYGGRHGKDAMDSVDNLMANTRNNPIEELDLRFPVRCEQYELRPEPAAPGRWRGGMGIVRRNRFLVDGTYSCEGDRHHDPPRGIFGGWDGLGASVRKNPETDREEALEAKVTGIPFAAGELIELREPNAAGYGDPLERDPALVREDVLDDFTTVELARDAYGVVFASEETLEVDAEATARRRAELRAARDGDGDGDGRRSGSLAELYAERGLVSRPPATSRAGHAAFGMG
jgi:N-methylhydantoinase B/oxoprolinase/acetone carboxylase alpha subunit